MQQELGGWEAFLDLGEQEENYGIFVLLELFSGKDFDEQLKLLSFAFELKEELGQPVSVVLAGDVQESYIKKLKKYSVSEIHVKKIGTTDDLLEFLEKLSDEKKPLVLAGDVEGYARDIFPYMAQRRDAGYLGGGEKLSISAEDRKVVVKRKIYGGLLVETVKNMKGGVQLVTLRIGDREVPVESGEQEVEVIEW